eukprot:gene16649-22900_t
MASAWEAVRPLDATSHMVLLQQSHLNMQELVVDLGTAKLELELAESRAKTAEAGSRDAIARCHVAQQQVQQLNEKLGQSRDRETMVKMKLLEVLQRNSELDVQLRESLDTMVKAAMESHKGANAAFLRVSQLQGDVARAEARAGASEKQQATLSAKLQASHHELSVYAKRNAELELDVATNRQDLNAAEVALDAMNVDLELLHKQLGVMADKEQKRDERLRRSSRQLIQELKESTASPRKSSPILELAASLNSLSPDLVRSVKHHTALDAEMQPAAADESVRTATQTSDDSDSVTTATQTAAAESSTNSATHTSDDTDSGHTQQPQQQQHTTQQNQVQAQQPQQTQAPTQPYQGRTQQPQQQQHTTRQNQVQTQQPQQTQTPTQPYLARTQQTQQHQQTTQPYLIQTQKSQPQQQQYLSQALQTQQQQTTQQYQIQTQQPEQTQTPTQQATQQPQKIQVPTHQSALQPEQQLRNDVPHIALDDLIFSLNDMLLGDDPASLSSSLDHLHQHEQHCLSASHIFEDFCNALHDELAHDVRIDVHGDDHVELAHDARSDGLEGGGTLEGGGSPEGQSATAVASGVQPIAALTQPGQYARQPGQLPADSRLLSTQPGQHSSDPRTSTLTGPQNNPPEQHYSQPGQHYNQPGQLPADYGIPSIQATDPAAWYDLRHGLETRDHMSHDLSHELETRDHMSHDLSHGLETRDHMSHYHYSNAGYCGRLNAPDWEPIPHDHQSNVSDSASAPAEVPGVIASWWHNTPGRAPKYHDSADSNTSGRTPKDHDSADSNATDGSVRRSSGTYSEVPGMFATFWHVARGRGPKYHESADSDATDSSVRRLRGTASQPVAAQEPRDLPNLHFMSSSLSQFKGTGTVSRPTGGVGALLRPTGGVGALPKRDSALDLPLSRLPGSPTRISRRYKVSWGVSLTQQSQCQHRQHGIISTSQQCQQHQYSIPTPLSAQGLQKSPGVNDQPHHSYAPAHHSNPQSPNSQPQLHHPQHSYTPPHQSHPHSHNTQLSPQPQPQQVHNAHPPKLPQVPLTQHVDSPPEFAYHQLPPHSPLLHRNPLYRSSFDSMPDSPSPRASPAYYPQPGLEPTNTQLSVEQSSIGSRTDGCFQTCTSGSPQAVRDQQHAIESPVSSSTISMVLTSPKRLTTPSAPDPARACTTSSAPDPTREQQHHSAECSYVSLLNNPSSGCTTPSAPNPARACKGAKVHAAGAAESLDIASLLCLGYATAPASVKPHLQSYAIGTSDNPELTACPFSPTPGQHVYSPSVAPTRLRSPEGTSDNPALAACSFSPTPGQQAYSPSVAPTRLWSPPDLDGEEVGRQWGAQEAACGHAAFGPSMQPASFFSNSPSTSSPKPCTGATSPPATRFGLDRQMVSAHDQSMQHLLPQATPSDRLTSCTTNSSRLQAVLHPPTDFQQALLSQAALHPLTDLTDPIKRSYSFTSSCSLAQDNTTGTCQFNADHKTTQRRSQHNTMQTEWLSHVSQHSYDEVTEAEFDCSATEYDCPDAEYDVEYSLDLSPGASQQPTAMQTEWLSRLTQGSYDEVTEAEFDCPAAEYNFAEAEYDCPAVEYSLDLSPGASQQPSAMHTEWLSRLTQGSYNEVTKAEYDYPAVEYSLDLSPGALWDLTSSPRVSHPQPMGHQPVSSVPSTPSPSPARAHPPHGSDLLDLGYLPSTPSPRAPNVLPPPSPSDVPPPPSPRASDLPPPPSPSDVPPPPSPRASVEPPPPSPRASDVPPSPLPRASDVPSPPSPRASDVHELGDEDLSDAPQEVQLMHPHAQWLRFSNEKQSNADGRSIPDVGAGTSQLRDAPLEVQRMFPEALWLRFSDEKQSNAAGWSIPDVGAGTSQLRDAPLEVQRMFPQAQWLRSSGEKQSNADGGSIPDVGAGTSQLRDAPLKVQRMFPEAQWLPFSGEKQSNADGGSIPGVVAGTSQLRDAPQEAQRMFPQAQWLRCSGEKRSQASGESIPGVGASTSQLSDAPQDVQGLHPHARWLRPVGERHSETGGGCIPDVVPGTRHMSDAPQEVQLKFPHARWLRSSEESQLKADGVSVPAEGAGPSQLIDAPHEVQLKFPHARWLRSSEESQLKADGGSIPARGVGTSQLEDAPHEVQLKFPHARWLRSSKDRQSETGGGCIPAVVPGASCSGDSVAPWQAHECMDKKQARSAKMGLTGAPQLAPSVPRDDGVVSWQAHECKDNKQTSIGDMGLSGGPQRAPSVPCDDGVVSWQAHECNDNKQASSANMGLTGGPQRAPSVPSYLDRVDAAGSGASSATVNRTSLGPSHDSGSRILQNPRATNRRKSTARNGKFGGGWDPATTNASSALNTKKEREGHGRAQQRTGSSLFSLGIGAGGAATTGGAGATGSGVSAPPSPRRKGSPHPWLMRYLLWPTGAAMATAMALSHTQDGESSRLSPREMRKAAKTSPNRLG